MYYPFETLTYGIGEAVSLTPVQLDCSTVTGFSDTYAYRDHVAMSYATQAVLPDGLTLDDGTGVVTGAMTAYGVSSLSVNAENSDTFDGTLSPRTLLYPPFPYHLLSV